MAAAEAAEAYDASMAAAIGSYKTPVQIIDDPSEEIMLLWALQQPTVRKQNSLVHQTSLTLPFDACGHHLTILQSPSSMSTPGVTGAVMWDSGIVLAKFLEHAVDSHSLVLQGKKAIELGSGCGLVGFIAALLGADVILTDVPDRLRLLKKNLEVNLGEEKLRGSAKVSELTWGDELDDELVQPLPDLVLGSDVVYSEGGVRDLLTTLKQLSGSHTTIFLSGELRNDAVLEFFLEDALEDFVVGHVDQAQWHPDFCSQRVAMFILVKKAEETVQYDC